MKIAFILPSLGNFGPIIIARFLIKNLVKTHLVDVYYFDEVRELDFPCSTYPLQFTKAINFGKYDIVHTHMLRPDLYIYFHQKRIPLRTKTISTIHQDSLKNLKLDHNFLIAHLTNKLWSIALNSFDRVVGLNNTIASKIPLDEHQISIIGNGIPFPDYFEIEDSDKKLLNEFTSQYTYIVGSSSLLKKVKGLDQIINVLPFFPEIGYIIVGDGPERQKLEALATELGVRNQCFFLGQRPQGYRFFKYFNFYMLPSLSEGFPTCAIEAAQFKLPIISSDIEVLREIFANNEVSFFELNNIESLRRALEKAIETGDDLSKRIFEKYKNGFSDEIMTYKYVELYEDLLHFN